MSLSWQSRLIEEADRAVTKCAWCGGFGHLWQECPEYQKFHARSQRKPSVWPLIWFYAGLLCGWFCGWMMMRGGSK